MLNTLSDIKDEVGQFNQGHVPKSAFLHCDQRPQSSLRSTLFIIIRTLHTFMFLFSLSVHKCRGCKKLINMVLDSTLKLTIRKLILLKFQCSIKEKYLPLYEKIVTLGFLHPFQPRRHLTTD